MGIMRRAGAAGGAVLLGLTMAGCSPGPWASRLVTVNSAGTDASRPAATDAFNPPEPVVSADGTKVAFVTRAGDLGPTDTNGNHDVYVRDLASGATTLVSADAAGTDGSNGESTSPVFSPDGTKVAFTTTGSNLGPADTGKPRCYPSTLNPPPPGSPCQDVYVRDLSTGTTTLVSANAAGTDSADAASSAPVFSPDGDVVAFESYATDFGPTDTRADCLIIIVPGQGPVHGPCLDVYARDLTTGTTSMISVNAAGTNGGSGSPSRHPVFSPDGTGVAFESSADDLVSPTAYFPYPELLLRDLTSGTTSLISAGPTGAPGNGESEAAVFSPDGTKVLFSSSSSNLGPPRSGTPGGSGMDLYVRDLATGSISQVTINAAGTDGGLGTDGSFSPDGTEVVFESSGSTLVANDTNGRLDVFLRDLSAGTTTLVSPNAAGTGSADDSSFDPRFNADGTKVVFTSWADDLGPTDTVTCTPPFPASGTRSCADVYVRDLPGRTTALVSADAAHTDASNGDAALPAFTPDGKVVYASLASNLGPTDTNGGWDVYIASVTPPPPP